jgi:tRNA U34 5-carboxymethylaminomethyl modifying enzyme MnmG/GidA
LAEAAIYREAAPQGLMAQLSAGQAPGWLEPVAMPKDSGLLVWAVKP